MEWDRGPGGSLADGAAKRVCVRNTIEPAPKSDRTLLDITRPLKAGIQDSRRLHPSPFSVRGAAPDLI